MDSENETDTMQQEASGAAGLKGRLELETWSVVCQLGFTIND